MSLFSTENKAVITYQVVIVFLIAIVLFLSIPAFANDYPHFGWLCLAVGGTAICAWLLIAGHKHRAIVIALCICLAVGVLAYATGVPSEWHSLTTPPKKGTSIEQEVQPINYLLLA
jgi:hypothetical protein